MSYQTETPKYDKMTVAQLREAAKFIGVGLPGLSRMKKDALLSAILEWEQAAVKVADRPVAFPEPTPIDTAIAEAFGEDSANKLEYSGDCAGCEAPIDVWITDDGSYRIKTNAASDVEHECFPIVEQSEVETILSNAPIEGTSETLSEAGQKSLAKSSSFVADAGLLGWTAIEQKTQDPAHWGITVARGGERIEIEWLGGVFQGDTCYYSHSARTPIKLRNASHAKKIMAIPAAQADEEARKVSAQKASRPARKSAGEATTERRKVLSFDPETATDEEVLSGVAGRSVAWTNEISGAIEDAHVLKGLKMSQGTSGRAIDFISSTGFRSVRVSSIVSVR